MWWIQVEHSQSNQTQIASIFLLVAIRTRKGSQIYQPPYLLLCVTDIPFFTATLQIVQELLLSVAHPFKTVNKWIGIIHPLDATELNPLIAVICSSGCRSISCCPKNEGTTCANITSVSFVHPPSAEMLIKCNCYIFPSSLHCRPKLLRNPWTLHARWNLREHSTRPISVHLRWGSFRSSLRGGWTSVRYAALQEWRHVHVKRSGQIRCSE